MQPTAISIEKVSKHYQLGSIGSTTLQKDLSRFFNKLTGREDSQRNIYDHIAAKREQSGLFIALDEVSMEIKQGDAVGLIGKNGAGKSTLLKVLSRITPPTSGEIKVHGRLSSLLEVGTGFHPDMTGRENIFLNGAILGMPKREIKAKLDEIIAFSGVERHIDTPVKRYSSGMYVRLAFAVAAHLEPEIMVVDEVLAVGDADFQRKCLGKMNEVAGHGRTVIFVSHQMSSVKALCNRGILLRKGQVVFDGDIDSAVNLYLENNTTTQQVVNVAELKREGECTLECQLVDFKVHNNGNENPNFIDTTKPIYIELTIKADEEGRRCGIKLTCTDGLQNLVMADSAMLHAQIFRFKKGLNTVTLKFDPMYLYKGDYHFDLMLYLPKQGVMDNIKDFFDFSVDELDPYRTGFGLERVSNNGVFHINHAFVEGPFKGNARLDQEVDLTEQARLRALED